jgi:hypothetical protein
LYQGLEEVGISSTREICYFDERMLYTHFNDIDDSFDPSKCLIQNPTNNEDEDRSIHLCEAQ